MSFQKVVGWCERCRADGLDSPIQLYPIGPHEAIRMCSNLDCSDMVNGEIQSDIVKIDIMPILHEFLPDPTTPVTDELSDSDEEFDYCCSNVLTSSSSASPSAALGPKDLSTTHHASVTTSGTAKVATEPLQRSSIDICEKAPSELGGNPSLGLLSEEHRGRICQDFRVPVSSHSAQVTAKPFGEPTVSIGGSTSTAAVCAEPSVYANSAEHVYRVCQTSTSTCGDAGQVFIKRVEESTINICDSISWCANSDVRMDTEEPTGNICDSASLCADFSLCVDDEEPSSDIFDSALLCNDSNVCMDAQEPTNNICESASLSADLSVCIDAEEPTNNTCDSALPCANSDVPMDAVETTSKICESVSPSADLSMCVDAEEPTDNTCDSALPYTDSNVRVDTGETASNICDTASMCADSNVCMDIEEHVYRTPHNSAVTCGDAIRVTADKERVHAIPFCDSAPTRSFSADAALHVNSHEHGSRSHDAVHVPITATVRVTASSSDSDLDDPPTTPPSVYLSSEVKTWKWNDTGEGHTFYTSLMPKMVAVKVVASSEGRPSLFKHELPIDNPCLETKKEERIEKTSDLFNLRRMGKVLKVKIVATSEVEPSPHGLSNNISTPTLLPSKDMNSWLEVLPEELEDEVNYAVQEPAVHSVPAHDLDSTKEPIVIISPPLQPNSQKEDVKCKDMVSSPAASPACLVECHPEREHWERAVVSPVDESISRSSEEGHVSTGVATESACSTCTTEDASMEWSDKENIVVPVSTACATDAAFSSAAALVAMNVENAYFHDSCNTASHNETSSISLSALSQEQEPISAVVRDFSDSTGHCDDESSVPSTEGQPPGETPELPKPLQEIGANAGPATSHELDVVEVTINSASQLDESDVAEQEGRHQEEQSCTINADQQNLTVAKDSSTKVLSLPTRSEASLVENYKIASEIEISSTTPHEPLQKCRLAESVVTDHNLPHLSCSPLSLPNTSEASLIENFTTVSEIETSSTLPPKPLQKNEDVKSVVTDNILHHLSRSQLSLHNINEESLIKDHEIASEVEISSTEPPEPLEKSGHAGSVAGNDIHLPCSSLSLPNGNELSLMENITVVSEIQISSTEPPEHSQKCGDAESVVTNHIPPSPSCSPNRSPSESEAGLQGQLVVVNEIPSMELPRSLAKEGQGTENTNSEFSNLQSRSEASSPGNLRALEGTSTDQVGPSQEVEGSKAVAASNNPLASSVTLDELPYLQNYSEESLSETSAIAGGTASLELPVSPKESWRSTENIYCYLDLGASACAPCGLPILEGRTEGSLPTSPGATNAAPSAEPARPVLKESNIIQGSSQHNIPTASETIPLSQPSRNEQADTEGVHMHDENFSSAASYCSSSPSRSEASLPEGSAVTSETCYSVGLLEPSQTAHSDISRAVINHADPSSTPNAITEATGSFGRSGDSAIGPVEDPLEDPLAASLSIAESMSNMGHHIVMLEATSAEDLCTNTSLTQKLPLQSSGLNVKHYTVLKGDAGGEGATAPPQRPTGSFKRMRSPSPSATFSNTVRSSTHVGGGSGTLQQCVSTALLQPSSALSNKPSSADAQEGSVTVAKRARSGHEAMKITIGTTTTGKAVVFSVTGLQKSMQNVVLKIPSNVVKGGDTQTEAVHPMSTRARAQNARAKRQKLSATVDSTVTSESRKSKTTEEKKKSTGCAVMDKLATINQALAVPIASESAPKNSKINARAPRRSGRTCTNKKEKQPKKWHLAVPKKAKQASSRQRKGGAPSEQVVPDILQPVLSPTSSDLSSISSKPSKSSFSGVSNNAASSVSTCKTGNSVWRSIGSCKSAEEYVEVIKNRLFPVEESGSGFPGYHPVLATRPPYNEDKKSTVIASKRRRTRAATPAKPTTEAASATVGVELDRYVSELSTSTDVSHYDSVLSELFDCIA